MGILTGFREEDGTWGKKYTLEIDGRSVGKVPRGLYEHVTQNFKVGDTGEFCDEDGVVSFMSQEFCRERDARTRALQQSQGFLARLFG